MTGLVNGNISLEHLPSLSARFELNEVSDCKFSQALKAEELSDFVVIRPDVKLNSSSLLEESVFEDMKATLSNRSGSAVLKDPLIRSIL